MKQQQQQPAMKAKEKKKASKKYSDDIRRRKSGEQAGGQENFVRQSVIALTAAAARETFRRIALREKVAMGAPAKRLGEGNAFPPVKCARLHNSILQSKSFALPPPCGGRACPDDT
jgi:septal ring factor EnvC (AmiA/AmiB activator)